MVRRTPTQRRWDLVRSCFVGLSVTLFGLALLLGPVPSGDPLLPRNPVAGAALMLLGVLIVTVRGLRHRRHLRERRERQAQHEQHEQSVTPPLG